MGLQTKCPSDFSEKRLEIINPGDCRPFRTAGSCGDKKLLSVLRVAEASGSNWQRDRWTCWDIKTLGISDLADPHPSCGPVLSAHKIGCSWFPPPEKDLLK